MWLLWKTIWRYLKILNKQLPYDTGILLQDIYSGEFKACSHKNVYKNAHRITIHNSQKV